jgi:DNA repair exonuclease SbcCD ATPase subunit
VKKKTVERYVIAFWDFPTTRSVQLAEQVSRVRSQLDYERSRNLKDELDRLSKSVEEDRSRLTKLEKQLAKLEEDEERVLPFTTTIENICHARTATRADALLQERAQLEELRQRLRELKAAADEKEVAMKGQKRELGKWLQQIGALHKRIAAEESLIDANKAPLRLLN